VALPPRRIPTIDIVRGVLMVLITCIHLWSNLDPGARVGAIEAVPFLLNGTVGFSSISGILFGYFLITRASSMRRVVRRYASRAALLILVAHPLISLALYGPRGSRPTLIDFSLRTIYVTDVFAFIFVFLVPVLPRVAARARLAVGIALIVASRFVLLIPAPTRGLLLVRELLAGPDLPGPTVLLSDYPMLSIVGMFLVGTWIGDRFALAERAGTLAQFARTLRRTVPCLLAGTAAMLGIWAACRWHVAGVDAPQLRKALYPSYLLTTYPLYLAGTLFLMALFMSHTNGAIGRFFLVFGRTSLFTYVLQYYVVQTLPWALRWQHRMTPVGVTAFVVVALPLLNGLAIVYDRVKTTGIRDLLA